MEMNAELMDALKSTAPRILEEAAFLFSDDLPLEEYPDAKWKPIGAQIQYAGEGRKGILRVWAGVGMVRTLAANMLGLEEDDESGAIQIGDALAELLNTIAGNVLTDAWGNALVFHLDIPVKLDAAGWMEDVDKSGLWFSVEGHPFFLLEES